MSSVSLQEVRRANIKPRDNALIEVSREEKIVFLDWSTEVASSKAEAESIKGRWGLWG